MKKFITALTALLTLTVTANAMSYTQAREQALFLTDKMAYELNFTEEQYDAAYEINLDYLMSVNNYNDLYGDYWRMRNLDLSYILLDWQYNAYCAASYFYRPLYWTSGVWHFAIYSRYPRRNYFYFGRPNIYVTYRGGHSWHRNGGHSWYRGRSFNHSAISRGHGMKDRFDRGDFHRGGHGGYNGAGNRGDKGFNRGNNGNKNNSFNGNRGGNNGFNHGYNGNDKGNNVNPGNRPNTGNNTFGNNGRYNRNENGLGQYRGNFRNNRESSTRTTARPSTENNSSSFSGGRRISGSSSITSPSRTFSPSSDRAAGTFNRSMNSGSSSSRSASMGGSSRSFGGSSHGSSSAGSGRSSGGGSSRGSFGGHR